MRKRKLSWYLVLYYLVLISVVVFSNLVTITVSVRSKQWTKHRVCDRIEYGAIMTETLAWIALRDVSAEEARSDYVPVEEVNPYEPFVVECSAYCYNGRCTASGKPTIEGLTIAGKKEWLGRTAVLYEINDDGGIGQFIGYREFTDTGYGQDSTLYPGKGTIQTGECVDLYFDDEQTALEWGRKKIYIQVIDGRG